MKQYLNKTLCYMSVSVLAAALVGCGGDDKKSVGASISGTAATGAPMIGTVMARGANGHESPVVTIGVDGSYRLNVAGLTAPFIIVADPDASADFFYSYAAAVNVIANVSPLTTMAMAMAANQNPATLAANWDGAVTAAQVQLAAQRVYANLQTAFTAQGLTQAQFDFFGQPFRAGDADDHYDVLLDNLGAVTYSFTGATPVITVNGTPVNTSISLATLDFDGDGVLGNKDSCFTQDHNLSADFDGDGCDDANEDNDDDNDGVLDKSDHCKTADFNLSADVDADGCDDGINGIEDEDKDIVTDEIAPKLSQVTAVPATGSSSTPSYTFKSSEMGTIIYAGDCSSLTTSAKAGNNTVTFKPLSLGMHSNCTVVVQDAAGNESTALAVNSFTITDPSLESWKLTITGKACVLAICTPFASESSTVATPGSLDLVKSYYGNYNSPEFKMTTTTVTDTATVKSFKVHYEVNAGIYPQKVDYIYTYTKQ